MDMQALARTTVILLGEDKVRELMQPMIDFLNEFPIPKPGPYCYRVRLSPYMRHRVRPR